MGLLWSLREETFWHRLTQEEGGYTGSSFVPAFPEHFQNLCRVGWGIWCWRQVWGEHSHALSELTLQLERKTLTRHEENINPSQCKHLPVFTTVMLFFDNTQGA